MDAKLSLSPPVSRSKLNYRKRAFGWTNFQGRTSIKNMNYGMRQAAKIKEIHTNETKLTGLFAFLESRDQRTALVRSNQSALVRDSLALIGAGPARPRIVCCPRSGRSRSEHGFDPRNERSAADYMKLVQPS